MATISCTALLSAVSGNSCLLVQIANYSLQDNDSTSSLNAHKTPLSLVYSGDYYWVDGLLSDRGSRGVFWSSTPVSTVLARSFNFVSTGLLPHNGSGKVYGLTIRCVVEKSLQGNMQDSICPKGWGLPVNGDTQTSKSWINLLFTSYSLQDNDSTSSLNVHKTPLSLIYSGNYNWVNGNLGSRGSGGTFWSSTPSSTAGAHYLNFNSTHLLPQNGTNKIHGFTIRCVVQ